MQHINYRGNRGGRGIYGKSLDYHVCVYTFMCVCVCSVSYTINASVDQTYVPLAL